MARFNFAAKVCVVTGASSGIGRALAVELAKKGARLALCDINMTGLEETLEQVLDVKGDSVVHLYKVDVTSRSDWERLALHVETDLHGADCLFNNAGATIAGTWEHLSFDEIDWQLKVNLMSVIIGFKVFLPLLKRSEKGRIINISSIFGLMAFPVQGPYCVSKYGVRALTESLWVELDGTNIDAICVHPGGIATNIEREARMCGKATDEEKQVINQMGQLLKTPAYICARQIVEGVEKGKRRILTGYMARTTLLLTRLFPTSYPKILRLFGVMPRLKHDMESQEENCCR